MSLVSRKSQFTDRRQAGQSDGLRAGLIRATAEKKSLPLVGITVDQSLQVRVGGLDSDHLDSIVTKLTNGGEIDRAIVVFRNADGKYLLADGFHRLEAYKLVGRKNVVCEVHDGDWEAARLYAETANMEHGLRINNEDKRGILESRLARKYYENEDGILASNAVIASDLGVADRTIAGWLDEMVTTKNFVVDLSKRVGKDGRVYEVEGIQTAQQQRVENHNQRKLDQQVAAESAKLAEWRASNVIFRAKYIADALLRSPSNRHLSNSLRIELPSENTPEEHKTFGYYVKAAHKHFRLTPGREETFIHDFQSTKDVKWYQELLSVVTPAIWEQADAQNWTEDEMQDWLDGFHQRQSAPLPSAAPRPGMAQPTREIEYQPPKPIGRHITGAPAPAVEAETRTEPPAAFKIGQNVEVFETGDKGIVHHVEYSNYEWLIHVKLYDGIHVFKADEIARVFAEVMQEALEQPYEPQPGDDGTCPYEVGQEVIFAETGEIITITAMSFHGNEWRLFTDDADGYVTIDQIKPKAVEIAAATSPAPQLYKPSNGTQTQMVENYMALVRLFDQAAADLQAIEDFDCNIQYLQVSEALEALWDSFHSLVHTRALAVSQVMFARLTSMASTGLPYDSKLAEEVTRKGMQRG